MARSLKVSPQYIQKAKSALKRNGYPSQKKFAVEVGISLSTVKNFLGGKPVDYLNFVEFCEKLGLDWQEICEKDSQDEQIVKRDRNNSPIPCTAYKEETWVGREAEIRELSEKLRKECRILIITGITGQGKTALAERLASVELGEEWQRLPAVNFDDGVSRDFVGAADVLLTRLGETVTPQERSQPDFLLNRLVQKLRTNRYLVQIDSVEVLLQKGDENPVRNEFEDGRWWEFFQQLLAGGECQSRLILTSQHLPTQFSSRYKNFWQRKALSGLSETEQLQLFSNLFEEEDPPLSPFTRGEKLNLKTPLTRSRESEFEAPLVKGGWGDLFINGEINPDSEAAGYLLQMGNTYEGHPLLIEVLAGEILEHPYNGNVVAYWRKHQQEFAEIAPARNSEELERNVKDRVRETLKRLEKDVPYAYTLLLRSSVYRLPVTEDFWLAMLEGLSDEEKNSALGTLKYRFLVEIDRVTDDGKDVLRQHNLIRNVAYQRLIEISNKGLEWKTDHYIAAQMWRTAYQPEPDASNLEQVRGYLEAFHHYCEVQDWESAGKILLIPFDTLTNYELHKQLGTWGYYREQIQLYSQLRGKLNSKWEAWCLNGLGNGYKDLGKYWQAIDYYEKCLAIAQDMGDFAGQATVLDNLGIVYNHLGQYEKAINYHQQALSIARSIGDRVREGNSLGNLGNLCNQIGYYSQAIEFCNEHLLIAREINDIVGEGTTLGNLGIAYFSKGDYDKAIDYHQQHLDISRKIYDRAGEEKALCNLGYTLFTLERYSEAQEYLDEALKIAINISDLSTESIILYNLAKLHQKLELCDRALEYCEQALALATELGIPIAKDCQKLKEELLNKD